jgi:hypothetical protein
MELVLDDIPPMIAQLEFPSEIDSTTDRLAARAAVKPAISTIKDVAFIVNMATKGDFTSFEADNKVVHGKRSAGDPEIWEAILPVPKGTSGKLVISARATSGVGLTGLVHGEAIIRAPAGAAGRPGAIEGKVAENDVAQPGLTVFLIDPEAKNSENPIKDQKKTAADGTYSFSDLKPGLYRVYCVKEATNRRATKNVRVEPGKTLRLDLDLLLP